MSAADLKSVVALCKRRGFIFPGSEIYGGFANTYSYGPLGAEMKRRVKELWWKRFIHQRKDMLALDGPIFLHPKTWKASGHVDGFSDALIDCKACKARLRVDHLIEEAIGVDVEGKSCEEMTALILEKQIRCPKCKGFDWTAARHFNLMFATQLSKVAEAGAQDLIYLRPETAQAIFLDFKNIVDTMRVHVPFGVAQIGKAFRNEITPGNFLFRQIEFEQMEIEYFIHESQWELLFEQWLKSMQEWCQFIGLDSNHLKLHEHPKEKLSHYSKRTVDIHYEFPFGCSELYGLAYRTDFDLKRHAEHSGERLEYLDPKTGERFVPHVIEPTFGLDRTILALLCDAYEEEMLEGGDTRTVLHLHPRVAPYTIAVFPLMKKEELVAQANTIFEELQQDWVVDFDVAGAIGKRYRRHDEIGTPICLTVDYDTLEQGTVTLRHRDTMKQHRVALSDLKGAIMQMIHKDFV